MSHTNSRRVARVRVLAAIALSASLLSCGGPVIPFVPGGALSGEVVETPVTDWSFVDDMFIHLETRPADPYSVELNYIVREGKLYIDPSEGKRWLAHIRADSRVRVRFSGKVYPLTAVLVGKPGELEGFDSDRFIYRLDPRGAPGG
ncbi:MAG: hypothetical protein JRH01_03505 [Deltaproteobacteria bacterium]|nr:hypothetical protein [Deltaproteobacteria bacterium]MBW2395309.1 hypothetical protein [Deltaproteobacteria bacterium]